MNDVLELSGFDDLEAFIRQMPVIALDSAEVAMLPALLFLHGKIPPYPGPALPGQAAQYWTPRQRRWFFANLRKGTLQVPYRRTGTLGRSFTEDVTRDEDSVTGEIGTNDRKAAWVVGPDFPGEEINGQVMYQARVHVNRWWQFADEMDAALPEAQGIFEDALGDELARRWVAA